MASAANVAEQPGACQGRQAAGVAEVDAAKDRTRISVDEEHEVR